ncbi:scarecrow-like protein 30 [Pistacia vera]|uniref:scarecrow-like protein 30 n=1 Tax=Pistacia vera TaxID=55513 RepID=UPI001263633F|nr:scarecrow-like protein 30 [Pistacia vera]XP_031254988.1 scarecrow-like protein 30 [Pistacia vera]XP_031254989.1 scarecrow-like protein 30 [Pistacia vera]
MDTLFEGFPASMNEMKFDHHGSVSSYSNQNLVNGFKLNHDSIDHHPPILHTNPPSDSFPSWDSGSDGDSPDSSDHSTAVLKYISEILMEEDLEGKPCMLQDCLALQAEEKSFYDVLGQKYPPSPNHVLPSLRKYLENPDDKFPRSSSSTDSCDSYYSSTNLIDSPESTFLVPNMFSEMQMQSSNQFSGEVGEASNFILNLDSVVFAPKSSPPLHREQVLASSVRDGRQHSSTGSRGRKIDQREGSDELEEGRNNKHSALSLTEFEQSEMDEILLMCKSGNNESPSCSPGPNGSNRKPQQNGQLKGSNGRATRTKKKVYKGEVVDLWSLLTQCAQAVASNDQRSANELLKQIRQHSSAFGDGNQRLAHYFANGLEARLVGTQTPIYSHISNRASAADILKAYRVHVTSCPFTRMSFYMANRTIAKLVEKATRLHIIDFGICYGFQWPCLIQLLSERSDGPPMLRITGIELPQPGFRPAERVEETGRRLTSYCERFNVPFKYHVIAKKWETIKLEDLKIDRDEVTVVNCLYRMKNLPDDTMIDSSPRDTVLQLIKNINPDLFIHGTVNGAHNAPFFLTRFREALFHFSALFDMYNVNVATEDEGRMLFEREVFGMDAVNTIACEGIERVERPETYKQWQVRSQRAGFRKLPLDQKIFETVRNKVKSKYHQDFIVDEDANWMLQGWKGRVIHALSFWKLVQD